MTPAHIHISVEVLFSAGILPTRSVGTPTIQGATVAGIQGIGVSTPRAAAVAAATIGLAGDIHTPNGIMFTIGILSMIVPAGMLLVSVLFVGRTTKELGATPIEHIIIAPIQLC